MHFVLMLTNQQKTIKMYPLHTKLSLPKRKELPMRYRVLSTTGSTRGTAYTMSNKILTHEGKTHVVWLDQIHKTYVCTYNHKTRRWSAPVFVGDGDDNHAGAALAMDPEGYLHLVFGPHHNPIQHAVSAEPNSATKWIRQPSFGGVNATYPSMVCDKDGTLHVCYRGAFERERPWGAMYQRKPKGGEWSDPVKLVDPEGPQAYTQFENALHLASDGSLFLAYHIVRATEADHNQVRGMGFGVMRSKDGGHSWMSYSGGDALMLPTAPASPCVIEFDEQIDVRIGNLVCTSDGTPLFTLNRREDKVHETFLYRWWNRRWDIIPLLPEAEKLFGNCMMSDCCSLSISDDGVLYAAATVCRQGGGWADPTNEIILLTSRDLGETFSAYKISPEDPNTSNWLPSLERATGHNKVGVPHLIYTHGEKGEGCSPDIDTEIRFVSLKPIARREEETTRQAIACVENLSGLQFTDDQRKEIQRGVETRRVSYRQLRDVDAGNEVEPPLVFLPWVSTPTARERKPFRPSSVESLARPDSKEELAFLPVTALARLVKSREVSPVALTRLYLDRLTAYGPRLRCVITLTEDLALDQAKAAETEIMAGRYRGPLHGIPWGAKDLLATRGIPTTWGATPFKEQVIDTDATVVERLRDAGAVLVAKLSMGALATGPHWFGGMTRNPWNTEKGSSGSSAGPGAATAAGLVGFGIGTETLGSIVSPSNVCGVVGLRPTYGRVSRYGAMALSWTMDKLGAMCRGVEDCAAVLDAIYGPDGRDRSAADVPFNWKPEVLLGDLRIGYRVSAFEAVKDPDARAIDAAALDVLRSLGANLEPADAKVVQEYPVRAIAMILGVEAAAAFDDQTRSGELEVMKEQDKSHWPATLRNCRTVSAVEYLRAQKVRSLLMRDVEKLMAQWDVILAPVEDQVSLAVMNLTGHPEVVVPCGFVRGMPRGLRFIGRLYDEATLLAVALAYEQATDWHMRHPDFQL
jgi:Asp-tRNA(Asn)/Glu-tRNA(Gln) amidotransferase A subunit family amidase